MTLVVLERKVEFSFRYFIIGIYKDRDKPVVRIYPVPFVRISIRKQLHTVDCEREFGLDGCVGHF
jgi:hypothetical protein